MSSIMALRDLYLSEYSGKGTKVIKHYLGLQSLFIAWFLIYVSFSDPLIYVGYFSPISLTPWFFSD